MFNCITDYKLHKGRHITFLPYPSISIVQFLTQPWHYWHSWPGNFCCRGGPMHCRMLCNLPGLYPRDATGIPSVVKTEISPDIATCHKGPKSPLIENHRPLALYQLVFTPLYQCHCSSTHHHHLPVCINAWFLIGLLASSLSPLYSSLPHATEKEPLKIVRSSHSCVQNFSRLPNIVWVKSTVLILVYSPT